MKFYKVAILVVIMYTNETWEASRQDDEKKSSEMRFSRGILGTLRQEKQN